MAILRLSISLLLGIMVPYAMQHWDRKRLAAERRASAWNAASWGSALYAFGPLSMLGWSWVTRQDWARWRRRSLIWAIAQSALLLFKGLLAAMAAFAIILAVDALLGLVAENPD